MSWTLPVSVWYLTFGVWSLPFDLAQDGEPAEPFRIWDLEFNWDLIFVSCFVFRTSDFYVLGGVNLRSEVLGSKVQRSKFQVASCKLQVKP